MIFVTATQGTENAAILVVFSFHVDAKIAMLVFPCKWFCNFLSLICAFFVDHLLADQLFRSLSLS